MTTRAIVFDRLSTLADSTRSRLLLLLERHELTVGELCSVLQLPQSTVSRHLRILGDDGWLVSRADGTSRFYGFESALDASATRLWALVREDIAAGPAAASDAQRVDLVLAERRVKSRAFFATAAHEWDHLRTELFGERHETAALLGLLDDRWTVGDLGCGTGLLTAQLSPVVHHVIAVDASAEMLDAARVRLAGMPNVDLRTGELELLPIADESLDAAIVYLVLHYVPEPVRALIEAHRVLRPGGRLLVVDMMPHARDEFRSQMGHVWQGFSDEQMSGWLQDAGFTAGRYRALPMDTKAKGPGVFVATGRRNGRKQEAGNIE